MEAVLGLDTLRIVERLQGFISNSHLPFFSTLGLPFELRVGTPFLKQSAAYTPKFARTVCKLHLKYMEPLFFWHSQMAKWGKKSIKLPSFNFDSTPSSFYNGRRHKRDIYAVRCMGNLWKTYARLAWASVSKVSPCEMQTNLFQIPRFLFFGYQVGRPSSHTSGSTPICKGFGSFFFRKLKPDDTVQ